MAEFHWVGSTAGNINSLRWGNTSNWRVVQNGIAGSTAPGGTLARLVPATRLPLGHDVIFIGTPNHLSATYVNPYQPARYNVFSPCLFGGVTTATDKVWEGITAGTASVNKNGPATIRVSPRYPFSRVGGYVDAEILNEWTSYTNSLLGTAFNGWTLSSGTEYDNAQYTATNWFGTTGGISFAQQTSYGIRSRGPVINGAHNRTTITLIGLTSGATGAAINPTNDGSQNRVIIQPEYSLPFGGAGNSPVEGFTGQAFPTNPTGEVIYDSASVVCSGHWNAIGSEYGGSAYRNANITLNGAKVNAFILKPNTYYTASGPASAVTVSQNITSPATSALVLGTIYIDETSSLRYVNIGNIKRYATDSSVVVLGDITPTGGFACLLPSGASLGASGGVLYTNGSLVVESPSEIASGDTDGALLRLGFSQYDGSTKSTTSIDKVYALQNTTASTTSVIDGPLDISEFHLHGGILEKGIAIQDSAAVTIDNLYMYGNAVYDQSTNPSHYNSTIKIRAISNSVSVKPGAQTTLDVGHVDNN